MLGYLLRNRKVWGLTIGFAAYGYSFYLFLTWLPGYLVADHAHEHLKSRRLRRDPLDLRDPLRPAGRRLAGRSLIARGYDETRARKTVLVGGMLLGLAVFGAMFTTKPGWAIVWISIALAGFRGRGAGRLLDRVADRAPRRHRHDRRHRQLHQQHDGHRWRRS